MKKIFALVLFAIFTLMSCSKDDSSDKKDNGPILLKKMIETYEDGSSLTSEYTYDGNKLMSIKYSDGNIDQYTYEGTDGNLSKIEKQKDGVLIEEENFYYHYNNMAYLLGYEKIIKANNYSMYKGYTYNNFNTYITTDEEYIFSGNHIIDSEGRTEYTSKYIMNGDNIFQKIDKYGANRTITTTYQYDVKNNPLRYSHSNNFIILARQNSGINNIIATNYSGSGMSEKMSAKYTYNSDNFPVTSEEITKEGKKIKREYFY